MVIDSVLESSYHQWDFFPSRSDRNCRLETMRILHRVEGVVLILQGDNLYLVKCLVVLICPGGIQVVLYSILVLVTLVQICVWYFLFFVQIKSF